MRQDIHADNIINDFLSLSFENTDNIDAFINNHLDLLSNDIAPITIITPGAGCDFESWGYTFKEDKYNSDGNALTDYMIRRGCDVSLGVSRKSEPTDDKYILTFFKQQGYEIYIDYDNINDHLISNYIINWNKHNAFLFGPQEADSGHKIYNTEIVNNEIVYSKISNSTAEAYGELRNFVNSIIYKYMLDYYNIYEEIMIPKINMIGHSRGGIINMQYAIEHPDVVKYLYSVGTPYNGSQLYNALLSEGIDICDETLNNNLMGLGFNNNSIADCIDYSSYGALKHYWNDYQNMNGNNHTKLYAIGCSMGLDYIVDFINVIITENIPKYTWFIQNIGFVPGLNTILNNTRKEEHDLFCEVNERYKSGELINKFNFVSETFDFYEFVFDLIDFFSSGSEYTYISDNDLIFELGVVLQGLFETMVYEYACQQYVLKNDLLVDLDSQQAMGYNNVIEFEKIITNNNYDLAKRAISDLPPVGHNLETLDEDVINCILSNLDLGSNDNGFNIKKIDDSVYEFIGFYYDRAVNHGVMTFFNVLGNYEYHISSKMFDCNYTLAQKLYKNRYDNYWENLNQAKNDGIIKIAINNNCYITDETFSFLKGQVYFTFGYNGDLLGENANYQLIYGCIYNGYKIVKYGKSSIYGIITDVNIEDINYVCDGAFFCQPIQRISIESVNTNISSIEVGKYSFYGCKWLNNFNTELFISSVNIMAFNETPLHNKTTIINNALIYVKDAELRLLSNSQITIVAPFAIDNDSNVEYIVLEKPNVSFHKDAIHCNSLNSIFIYTNYTNINKSYFYEKHPYIYTAYSFNSGKFDNDYIRNTVKINFWTLTNHYKKQLIMSTLLQNELFTINDIGLPSDTNVLGFRIDDLNTYFENVMTEFSFFRDADVVFNSYVECQGAHSFGFSESDEKLHTLLCNNCHKKLDEEHSIIYSELANNNASNTHLKHCEQCTYYEYEDHEFVNMIYENNNRLYHKKVCKKCGYYEIMNETTIVYQNGMHYLSNGELLEHSYIDYEYQNFIISVCEYCGLHEHKGIVTSYNNTNYHKVLCAFCQTEVLCPHVLGSFISIDDDIYDGYHMGTCLLCNQVIESGHHFDYDEHNDLHHLKCIECEAENVFEHTGIANINPNSNYHSSYCEFCDCYLSTNHHYTYYDVLSPSIYWHFSICSDCGYIKNSLHENNRFYNNNGHYDVCTVCGYTTNIVSHNISVNCNDTNPNNHYLYCNDCGYTFPLMMNYSIRNEYEHYCKCSICNLQVIENHLEHCTYYNEQLHTYQCELCEIEYQMPHFVNDHLIIYENYEPGYDLYVCTYCGYTERRRREN